jgi:microcystin-dependent protein
MKNKSLPIMIMAIFIAQFSFAQTSSKGFSFQGYAIYPDGKALASTAVTVQFTLSSGGSSFTEEHAVTSDAFGVFHAIVGNSSVAKNTEFTRLNFTSKATDYNLKVDVKKTSGGTYTTISNAPMNAVPYARHAANGVPVGTIVAFGGDQNNVPEGWLLCNGASVARASYPQLYDMIGDAWGGGGASFNLPDLRGRFLRGVALGTANDPDRAARTALAGGGNTGDLVGSYQGDAFRAHNHPITDPSHTHSYQDTWWSEAASQAPGATSTNPTGRGSNGGDGDNVGWDKSRTTNSSSTGISVNNNGGNETRPINANVHYIIKF